MAFLNFILSTFLSFWLVVWLFGEDELMLLADMQRRPVVWLGLGTTEGILATLEF